MKITIKRKELASIATIASKTVIKPSKTSDGFLGVESDGDTLYRSAETLLMTALKQICKLLYLTRKNLI